MSYYELFILDIASDRQMIASNTQMTRLELRPSLKKSLFPVQRVAEIVASRAAAKSPPPLFFFVW